MRADLLARLPVHEGDTLGPDQIAQTKRVVQEFGYRLIVAYAGMMPNGRTLVIGPQPSLIQVGGNLQASKIQVQPKPVYPLEAKQAHLEGVVQLHALIGKNGTVETLHVLSGHPLLVPSALEAVRQWVYQPTLLNGDPVGVETEIDVHYTLLK